MLINKGQYGQVYRANTVAIKEMDISRASNWLIELILMRTLKCDRLMTARDIVITNEKVSIYMDFMEFDLWTWRNKRMNVSTKTSEKITSDVAIGLAYLHYCDILHGDLKPSNVLVSLRGNDVTCKITDFGYSSVLSKPKSIRYGTGMYSPPECIIGMETKFTADIWAFGLVISYVVTGRLPWRIDKRMMDLLGREWFVSAAYRWSIHTGQEWPHLIPRENHEIEMDNAAVFTGRLYSLMKGCLSVDRHMRPSAIDIAEELAESGNIGINLSAREEACRCCHCNFDTGHAEVINTMLTGEYVDIKDTAYQFIQAVINIDFMPTLRCRSRDRYDLSSIV